MFLIKKTLIILFLLIPLSNSYAAMVVFNQQTTINTRNSLDAGTGSDHKHFGVVAGIEFNKDGT